jgi:hypothetical protein
VGAREAGLHLSRGTGVALSVPLIRKGALDPAMQEVFILCSRYDSSGSQSVSGRFRISRFKRCRFAKEYTQKS